MIYADLPVYCNINSASLALASRRTNKREVRVMTCLVQVGACNVGSPSTMYFARLVFDVLQIDRGAI